MYHDTHKLAAALSAFFLCATLVVSYGVSGKTVAADSITPVGVVHGVPGQQASVPGALFVGTPVQQEGMIGGNDEAVPTDVALAEQEFVVPNESLPQAREVSDVEVTASSTVRALPPAAIVSPQSTLAEAVAIAIHERTNEVRVRQGLPPLASDARLVTSATTYSATLQAGHFLGHLDQDGCDMTCRFQKNAYDASSWGENLGYWPRSVESDAHAFAGNFVDAWMESTGHRENILSSTYTSEGVGVTVDEERVYVVVHFALPK